MKWVEEYYPEVLKDLKKLDGSQKNEVKKAIKKISNKPLPFSLGGYGKPLGNKNGINLNGYFKVKLKKSGIRIVYEIKNIDNVFVIVIIGLRNDCEVYKEALARIQKKKK